MNEYYEMGKQAALESLAELYDSNGGVDIGYGLEVISESLFDDQDKIASVQTEEDAIFLSGFEAELMGFAKEASDMMAEGWEGDIFLATLEKVAARRSDKEGYDRQLMNEMANTGSANAFAALREKDKSGKRVNKNQGVSNLGRGYNITSHKSEKGNKNKISTSVSNPNVGRQAMHIVQDNKALAAGGLLAAAGGAYGAKKLYDRHKARKEEEQGQMKAAAQIFFDNGLIDEDDIQGLLDNGFFE